MSESQQIKQRENGTLTRPQFCQQRFSSLSPDGSNSSLSLLLWPACCQAVPREGGDGGEDDEGERGQDCHPLDQHQRQESQNKTRLES